MAFPVKLQTPHGQENFLILQEQFNNYKEQEQLDAFHARCRQDYIEQSAYLEYFLDDDKLSVKYPMNDEDVEGFRIFKEQSDVCSALNHFAEKLQ